MITSLYIVLSAALGASWALTVLCSLSYVFEIQMSCIRKIFCMASITALTLLLMCIFYDRAVPLRTIIVISYIFVFIYAEAKSISKSILAYVVFIIEMATAELCNIAVVIITGYYSVEQCFFVNAAAIMLMNASVILLKRRFMKRPAEVNQKAEQLALLVMTLVAVCIAAALQITFENAIIGRFDLNVGSVPIFLAVVGVMYITAGIAALGFIKGMREERKNRTILEQQRILEDMYDNTRMFRHNYKNTLIMLKGYCDNGKYDELSEKMNELTNDINDVYLVNQRTNLLDIEDAGLRNLIMIKLLDAERSEVRFSLKILGRRFRGFESLDMMNVIGILIDNAIEAASGSDKREAELEMRVYEKSEFITIINSFKTKPDMSRIFDKHYSTKSKDGLGLYYVNKTLQRKENVDFSFDCRKDYFIANIAVSKQEGI